MSQDREDKRGEIRAFYDQAAVVLPELSLLNYGYADADTQPAPQAEPEFFCLELYRRIARDADLAGKRVLEASCGRGGGVALVMAEFRPATLVGVDLSEENIRLARQRCGDVQGLAFEVGDVTSLPFSDQSFDAVLNVEASHLYDDPAAFFGEVHRLLRRGGQFFYADLFWADSKVERLLATAGLVLRAHEDLTPGVLRALELDTHRRQSLESRLPEHLRPEFRDWSGIPGHRAYNRFAGGEWLYRCFRLERP